MKNPHFVKTVFVGFVILCLSISFLQAQNPNNAKAQYIKDQTYLKPAGKQYQSAVGQDSLFGFDENAVRINLLSRGLYGEEYLFVLNQAKRSFINDKYKINQTARPFSSKGLGTGSTINNAPCVNEDFELTAAAQYNTANAVTGWLLQTGANAGNNGACLTNHNAVYNAPIAEFWIRQTPVSNPYIGTVGPSPLGGQKIAQLNDVNLGYAITRISTTFTVTSSNNLFRYAFCGAWNGSGHTCCDSPFGRIDFYDCFGNVIPCASRLVAGGSSCALDVNFTYSVASGGVLWTNWQTVDVDLSPYMGTCLTVKVTAGDCSGGTHAGMMYFDSRCDAQPAALSYCAGSSLATFSAPIGYNTYTWVAPFGSPTLSSSQASSAVITVTNPVPSAIYTVNLGLNSNCPSSATFAINPTSVNIGAIGSSPSCTNGASGSATVQGTGSAAGYNYTWYNSTSSVVGTSSVATGLPPGNYSVNISAFGSPGCGTASATTTISVVPNGTIQVLKPYCGTEAYLSASTGTNYQWYNGLTPITASLGGTAPTYTVTNPVNTAFYWLSYLSSQGCRDSIKFVLVASSPGNMAVTANSVVCAGSGNGQAIISLTPGAGAPGGGNYFIVTSTGTTAPYSASVYPTPLLSFSVTGIVGGSTYSVNGFDGVCKYTSTFTANTPAPFDYSIITNSSAACQPACLTALITFTGSSQTGQYTYSWSPGTFMSTSASAFTSICPTIAAATQTNITYTIVVTPTVANCPKTKTLTVNMGHAVIPTVSPVPNLCLNGAPVTINVNPPGGTFLFTGGNAVSPTGVITPSLTTPGPHTFSYVTSIGSCSASTSQTFFVSAPSLTFSGNQNICSGSSTTLTASGADAYAWFGGPAAASFTVSPAVTTSYSVTGTNTVTGCAKTISIPVFVTPTPTLSVTGNLAICEGGTATLTASGANTYSWNPGFTGASISLFPAANISLTLTGTGAASCTASTIIMVTVTPNPTLNISGNQKICKGEKITLVASGANTYSWTPSVQGATLNGFPGSSTVYTITGINNPGTCKETKLINVTVLECVGIEDIKAQNNSVLFYPNPTSGKLYFESAADLKITIYDVRGRLILEKKFSAGKNEVDLSAYSEGAYHVIAADHNGVQTKVVIKKEN